MAGARARPMPAKVGSSAGGAKPSPLRQPLAEKPVTDIPVAVTTTDTGKTSEGRALAWRILKAPKTVKAGYGVLRTSTERERVLIIDLNNFSTFPTLAIGILVASLRNVGFEVELISPLAHDIVAASREHPETWRDHLARRIHLSTSPSFRRVRDRLRRLREQWRQRKHQKVVSTAQDAIASKPDIVLLSAYLEHFDSVRALGELCRAAGIPLLLGGPVFNYPETADFWRSIPGLTAIVGAEVDLTLPEIVSSAISGGDLLQFSGVTLPDGRTGSPAMPLRNLNSSPVPDFTDFPWDRYPVRVVPLMASRGCQWDRCTFCSDIISVSGRTFRTRSAESVMHEVREQAKRHATGNFLFLDLKLNSNPALLRGIVENMQRSVPGAQWIGTVHVDTRKDNGLSRGELREAVRAGMRRVSFGLETGSQRLLDAMDKGSTVEGNAEFLRDAHDAGLSVRCTMFKGYPGETSEDLEATFHVSFEDMESTLIESDSTISR